MGKDKVEKAVDGTLKKYKKRMKRLCCCGFFWQLFGLISVVVGITMLVYFTKYWGDQEHWERGLAYFGVALLILSVIMLAVGIILCVILRKIYKKLNPTEKTNYKMFKAKKYGTGKAPYPQQPPEPPQRTVPAAGQPGAPGAAPGAQPSAPGAQPLVPGPQPTGPPAGQQDVHLEISDHHKF